MINGLQRERSVAQVSSKIIAADKCLANVVTVTKLKASALWLDHSGKVVLNIY